MDTRVAVIAIIAQTREVNDRLNMVLHEYGEYIIGRMGLPYRERGIHIISIVVDAPQDVISALSGKLGSLPDDLGQGGLRQTGLKGALVMRALMEKLLTGAPLSCAEYAGPDRTMAGCGRRRAVRRRPRRLRDGTYGKDVYLRGLIEVSNYCKNDCRYCGIRRSNTRAERYRLTPDEILDCCARGYARGLRTFVLQGGEDAWFTCERVESLVRQIKGARYP